MATGRSRTFALTILAPRQYDSAMEIPMIELTPEQRLGLNTDAPRIIDPETRTMYVLVKEDVYERLEALLVLHLYNCSQHF